MDAAMQAVTEQADRHVWGLLSGDVDILTEVLDDTLVWTHSSGKVDSKDSFIAPFRTGPSRYKAFDRTIEKLRPYGDIVIQHGVAAITSQRGDIIRQINNRFIAVWRYSGEQWRLIAWQSTRAEEAGA
jgi:Domain of unknown function (DUF4440)